MKRDGDDRRRPQLHRRRRHPPLRQAARRRRRAAATMRSTAAPSRWSPPSTAMRWAAAWRTRWLPLPHRRAERQGRAARGADRHPARRRRHAAAAAPDRAEAGAGDDRHRPARAGRRRPRRSASSTSIVEGKDLRSAAIAFAKRIADKRPLPRVRDMTDQLAEAEPSPACSTPCASRSPARPATRRRPTTASLRSRRRPGCPSTRASAERAAVRRAGELRRGQGPALRLLRRARGGQAPGPAEGHADCPRSRPRRGGRRRHHGRRHRHELRRLRLPGEAARRLAGGAGARHGPHPRQLRRQRQARQPRRRRRWTSAWR